MNLFAYGSLGDRRLISKLIGRTLPPAVPATLHGYRKWETTLGYPIVLPESGSSTSGIVYFSLTEADWNPLDVYEGTNSFPPNYFRRLVTVEGKHGNIATFTYIANLNFFRTRIVR